MRFTKHGNRYQVSRITGNQDNILGVSFTESEANIQVIEWVVKCDIKEVKKTSPDEVLQQVLLGLKDINEKLGKNYKLSKVYFVPTEDSSHFIYKYLIAEIVKRVDSNSEFETL